VFPTKPQPRASQSATPTEPINLVLIFKAVSSLDLHLGLGTNPNYGTSGTSKEKAHTESKKESFRDFLLLGNREFKPPDFLANKKDRRTKKISGLGSKEQN
jgi:hypothetical protein